MKTKKPGLRKEIRYSEAFKMEVVRELEAGELAFDAISLKYGIQGTTTVSRRVRQYGNGTRGKVMRVERPGEINELKRLHARVRLLESALADANIEVALERAYTRLACQRGGITDVAGFKKSRWPAGPEAVAQEGDRFGITVSAVCRKVGITRQNYYARRKARQRRGVDAGLVGTLVRAERQLQPRLGTRKLPHLLKADLARAGVRLGRDRFLEVLRAQDLLLAPKPAAYPCTTNSHHCLPVFTNRIKDLVVSQPNEVWVGDLTYVRTAMGFLNLALLTDKASRKVVGYHCGDTLAASGCLAALKQALADLPAGAKPIHHSDQGTQYCSHEYVNWVKDHGLSLSMTETDHCAENALAERMNGILKSEYGLGGEFPTKAGGGPGRAFIQHPPAPHGAGLSHAANGAQLGGLTAGRPERGG